MRFLVTVPADERSEAGELPSEELIGKMGAFNQQMIDAGIMLSGEGLHPTSKGARIVFSSGSARAIEGPFPEVRIAGYWVIAAESLADAIAWMKRAPFEDGVELEIRQIFEMDDFGDALTPDLRDREARQRASIENP